jgi:hypothetical protein
VLGTGGRAAALQVFAPGQLGTAGSVRVELRRCPKAGEALASAKRRVVAVQRYRSLEHGPTRRSIGRHRHGQRERESRGQREHGGRKKPLDFHCEISLLRRCCHSGIFHFIDMGEEMIGYMSLS